MLTDIDRIFTFELRTTTRPTTENLSFSASMWKPFVPVKWKDTLQNLGNRYKGAAGVTVLLSYLDLRDKGQKNMHLTLFVSFIVSNFGDKWRETWSNECVDETVILVFSMLLIRSFYSYKVCTIHLIPKRRPINYSFVCMLISPLCLVNMYKKTKEL